MEPIGADGVQHVALVAFHLGFFARRIKKAAASKIIHAARGQFKANFVIIFTAGLMRVKRTGRGVVERHGGHDAHLHALVARHFGNGNHGHVLAVHAKAAIGGLDATGHGGSGGSGIRNERINGIRGGCALHGQLAHVELDDAGGGVALLRSQIQLRRVALGHAHAVAYEQNDVLGLPCVGNPHKAEQHDAKNKSRASSIVPTKLGHDPNLLHECDGGKPPKIGQPSPKPYKAACGLYNGLTLAHAGDACVTGRLSLRHMTGWGLTKTDASFSK
ncbi:hypothetical protein SDC9_93837 [bioreactor metagenome]|uniref:Uncharacterized protein n=2 Tax=root TaxID=1 RepID=A0A212JZ66_9BACT|nr:hypothetical protein KM92DES2_11968 [uncultured Desulfovibrio sp.]